MGHPQNLALALKWEAMESSDQGNDLHYKRITLVARFKTDYGG